jgi:hypothetical protein
MTSISKWREYPTLLTIKFNIFYNMSHDVYCHLTKLQILKVGLHSCTGTNKLYQMV